LIEHVVFPLMKGRRAISAAVDSGFAVRMRAKLSRGAFSSANRIQHPWPLRRNVTCKVEPEWLHFVHRKLISTSARYGLRPLIHSRLVFRFGSGSLRSRFSLGF
jgi:hypothetical protein